MVAGSSSGRAVPVLGSGGGGASDLATLVIPSMLASGRLVERPAFQMMPERHQLVSNVAKLGILSRD